PTRGSIQIYCVSAVSEAETVQKIVILTLLREIEATAANAKVRKMRVRGVNSSATKNIGKTIETNLGYIWKSRNWPMVKEFDNCQY
ncbi:MAG: hypothetical protein ACUVXA_20320, partial [Candidatus Jordarchaeum sp.]|uniref:hypothetical protein n=1 Tax=Candidatus Jordarchaeum sp. TaxID=2823881 RepID=UPI00404B28F0